MTEYHTCKKTGCWKHCLLYLFCYLKDRSKGRKDLRMYNFRGKINLMISCSPNPRLVGNTSLNKSCPRIPSPIIMIKIIICIWKIPNKQHSLPFDRVLFIMSQSRVWIITLSKIPCKNSSNWFNLGKENILEVTLVLNEVWSKESLKFNITLKKVEEVFLILEICELQQSQRNLPIRPKV